MSAIACRTLHDTQPSLCDAENTVAAVAWRRGGDRYLMSASAAARVPLLRDALVESPDVIVAFVRAALKRSTRVVVICGAGLSTSAGVRDFRSPDGLFEALAPLLDAPPLDSLGLSPRDVFCGETFSLYPNVFWHCAHKFLPSLDSRPAPTRAHVALRELDERGALARIFTMNIDGLEETAGVCRERVSNVHGDARFVVCTRCKSRTSVFEPRVAQAVAERRVPTCDAVNPRGWSCGAVLAPDVVLYQQKVRLKKQHAADVRRADLVVVIGTSLDVEPLSSLHTLARPAVPRIFINFERIPRAESTMDVCLLGAADDIVDALVSGDDGGGSWVADGRAVRFIASCAGAGGGAASCSGAKRARCQ